MKLISCVSLDSFLRWGDSPKHFIIFPLLHLLWASYNPLWFHQLKSLAVLYVHCRVFYLFMSQFSVLHWASQLRLTSRYKPLTSCSGAVVSQHPAACRQEVLFLKGDDMAVWSIATPSLLAHPQLPPSSSVPETEWVSSLLRQECRSDDVRVCTCHSKSQPAVSRELQKHLCAPSPPHPTQHPLCVVQGFFFYV